MPLDSRTTAWSRSRLVESLRSDGRRPCVGRRAGDEIWCSFDPHRGSGFSVFVLHHNIFIVFGCILVNSYATHVLVEFYTEMQKLALMNATW